MQQVHKNEISACEAKNSHFAIGTRLSMPKISLNLFNIKHLIVYQEVA